MKKRGLSTIVTSLILILLVLVAIAIVWVVIKNILSKGAEEVNIGQFTVDLNIKDVNISPMNIDVTVKRNPGAGEISGLKFAISDGFNTSVYEETTNIKELEEQKFRFNYNSLVKEIALAPMFKSKSGKTIIGQVVEKRVFSNKEIIKNSGGMSWFKFDSSVNDELGYAGNIANGSIDCNVEGKFGKACYFNGIGNWINTTKNTFDFITPQNGTIAVWVKPTGVPKSSSSTNQLPPVICDEDGRFGIYVGIYPNGGNDRIWILNFDGTPPYESNITYTTDNWVHVTWLHNGTTLSAYKDGALVSSIPSNNTVSGSTIKIGYRSSTGNFFNGTIDELIIFNSSLSENAIKALANLDLSSS